MSMRIFLDVSDLRVLFQTTADENTQQSGFLTRSDFKHWLMKAVNWVGFCHVDFGLSSEDDIQLRSSVLNFKGMEELYHILNDVMSTKELVGKTIFSCYGFIDGDILYLMIDAGLVE